MSKSMERLYVSKKNETVRMFESDFIEFFSRVHPVTPLLLYVPVVGYMLYISLWQRKLSILAVTGLFLVGILLWTLLEYLIHRYIFHYMPPSISIPLAFFFYGLFLLIFGRLAPTVFAGLVFGYVCYDMLHYATHHFPMKRGLWLWLKQYHLRHHYRDDQVGYGISSPLWDYVFRTTRK